MWSPSGSGTLSVRAPGQMPRMPNPLADAAATSVGNHVQTPADINEALEIGKNIKGVEGILVIIKNKIGMWGDLEIVPLQEKRLSFRR